jgi:hypothetical protein
MFPPFWIPQSVSSDGLIRTDDIQTLCRKFSTDDKQISCKFSSDDTQIPCLSLVQMAIKHLVVTLLPMIIKHLVVSLVPMTLKHLV